MFLLFYWVNMLGPNWLRYLMTDLSCRLLEFLCLNTTNKFIGIAIGRRILDCHYSWWFLQICRFCQWFDAWALHIKVTWSGGSQTILWFVWISSVLIEFYWRWYVVMPAWVEVVRRCFRCRYLNRRQRFTHSSPSDSSGSLRLRHRGVILSRSWCLLMIWGFSLTRCNFDTYRLPQGLVHVKLVVTWTGTLLSLVLEIIEADRSVEGLVRLEETLELTLISPWTW